MFFAITMLENMELPQIRIIAKMGKVFRILKGRQLIIARYGFRILDLFL